MRATPWRATRQIGSNDVFWHAPCGDSFHTFTTLFTMSQPARGAEVRCLTSAGSHHDYPADAEERLAKTAASIIGIKRGAMVTWWETDHSRYGVVNPKQDALNVDEVEGVGKRIMLRGESYNVLADYIIGNGVDGSNDEYYVRHPEEDEVYIAKLDIDLSTKFTDWIETDLLDVDSWDVREIVANNYSFDELKGQITNREVTALSRKTSSDDWKLDGLKEEIEEVNKDTVRDMVNAIGDLKIAGVRRPKS